MRTSSQMIEGVLRPTPYGIAAPLTCFFCASLLLPPTVKSEV